MTLRSRPFALVLAAPSGAGKTSLARALVERNDDVVFSISVTTRPAREDERPAKDYHFVSDAEFDRMIAAGELAEWAVVHGRRYGTPRRAVEQALACGQVAVLDIDVQGAQQVRSAQPDAVLVFVLPPTAEELNHRLARRGSEHEAERRRRLEGARRELPAAGEFDYLVRNDDLEKAVRSLESIVAAERRRVGRVQDLPAELDRLDRELALILERSE